MLNKVVFLDDLVRSEYWPAKEFFYDNLAFVFDTALNINVGGSARKNLSLADKNSLEKLSWIQNYASISEEYKIVLDKIIENVDMVIGYELSPGLINYLNNKSIVWINFRISPLRFLEDLLVSITSSSRDIRNKIQSVRYPEYEIKLQANKLMASYRHHERYVPKSKSGVYFIGQTSSDASLICNGEIVTIKDYKEQLLKTKTCDEIFYLKHPSALPEYADLEIKLLKDIYDNVIYCNIPLYDLFLSESENQFISLSSGSIQESSYFNKAGRFLYAPVCPLSDNQTSNENEFVNITFTNFIDRDFWACIFNLNNQFEIKSDNIKVNELRTLHNVWWGYAKLLAKENDVNKELHKPIFNEIEVLNKKQFFSLELVSSKPNFVRRIIIGFFGGDYQWFGRKIKFTKEGEVFEHGINVGEWKIIGLLEKKIILIWHGGNWVDSISTNDNWRTMDCKNNLGDTFKVSRIR